MEKRNSQKLYEVNVNTIAVNTIAVNTIAVNTIAVKDILDWEDYLELSEIIEKLEMMKPTCPKRPKTPVLKSDHSSSDAVKYAMELSVYENKMVEYDLDIMFYETESLRIDNLIEEYLKVKSGLNLIPEKSQTKVWNKAWAEGHHHGYVEVYGYLTDLVELF